MSQTLEPVRQVDRRGCNRPVSIRPTDSRTDGTVAQFSVEMDATKNDPGNTGIEETVVDVRVTDASLDNNKRQSTIRTI